METRVLHVASGDLWAGAEVQLYYLATAQRDLPAVVVSVALLNEGILAQRLRGAGIPVHVIDERTHGTLGLLSLLQNIRDTFRPNVIHTHRRKENLLGALARRGLHDVVSVRTVHGAPEGPRDSLRQRVLDWSDQLVGKLLQHKIVAVTPHLEQALGLIYGAELTTCIENGIDDAAVERDSNLAPPIEPTHRIRVGFAGRLVPVKRVDVFLRMASELVRRGPGRFEFLVIGDGPERESLERLADELGLRDAVNFLGFRADALPLIRSMDAMVLTSDHEGLPMIALEALAVGTPMVSHAVGGLPDLLSSPGTGALVSSQDPVAFAAAVEAVTAERRSSRKSLVAERFTSRHCARAYAGLYRELLAVRGAHAPSVAA